MSESPDVVTAACARVVLPVLRKCSTVVFAILNNQPTLFIDTTLTGDNLVPAQHLLFDNIAFEATPIPEPSVAILLLIGGMLMAFLTRRRHPQASCAA